MAKQIEDVQLDSIDRLITQWRNENIESDLLPMAILGRLAKLGKYIDNDILHCHQQHDLRQGEFDVLATLRRSGKPYSLTPSELYQSMLLTSGAMTSRLDRLETKGLIRREHSQADRRSIQVTLTTRGKKTIDSVLPAHIAAQHRLLDGVSQRDRQVLAQLLKRWLTQLESVN
ncbi:MarR family winged helix-turn-helix transcriptional regulator [Methylophaga pinxianii]|uniref:MarR family winged helix-turn-helix transcriptional regulator n=1 Tax=Methylophaga pinxianii TaxID=2881052 RepID=UPI001CF0F0D7|nr:MarR family transcriptional regulator [Methylophaga pinxianii]MCB2427944.1 MarR family transcriptional regulator [Methylophaga pinxianii]UPH44435.1 MarR family transcriptional regulator [Methylophaga pinxianii]